MTAADAPPGTGAKGLVKPFRVGACRACDGRGCRVCNGTGEEFTDAGDTHTVIPRDADHLSPETKAAVEVVLGNLHKPGRNNTPLRKAVDRLAALLGAGMGESS